MFRCQECGWSSNSGKAAFKHEAIHPLQVHCYEPKAKPPTVRVQGEWSRPDKWKDWVVEEARVSIQEEIRKKLQQKMIEQEELSKKMAYWQEQAVRKTVGPYYRPKFIPIAVKKNMSDYQKSWEAIFGNKPEPKPEPQVQEVEISIAVRPKRKFNLTE